MEKRFVLNELKNGCHDIQIWGLTVCNDCKAKNTTYCNGEEIKTKIKVDKNELRYKSLQK